MSVTREDLEWLKNEAAPWEIIDMFDREGFKEYYNVYSEDSYTDYINETMYESDMSWRDIRDWLEDLPSYSDTDYYYNDDYYGNWSAMTYDDFGDLIDKFEDYCHDEGLIEEPDVEDDEEPEASEECEFNDDIFEGMLTDSAVILKNSIEVQVLCEDTDKFLF